jgi:hypothetical protein
VYNTQYNIVTGMNHLGKSATWGLTQISHNPKRMGPSACQQLMPNILLSPYPSIMADLQKSSITVMKQKTSRAGVHGKYVVHRCPGQAFQDTRFAIEP